MLFPYVFALRFIVLSKTIIYLSREKIAQSAHERKVLKDRIGQRKNLLKSEKKKFKGLQKEVDKMAKLMADTDDDDEERGDAVYDVERETESEDESESEESDGQEASGTDDDSIPLETRRNKLQASMT